MRLCPQITWAMCGVRPFMMTAFPTSAGPAISRLPGSGPRRFEALSGRPRSFHAVPTADCRRRATGGAEPAPELRPLSGAVAHTASVRPWRGPLTQAQEAGRVPR